MMAALRLLDLKKIEIARHADVWEDGLGFGQNVLLAIAAREVGQDQLPDAGFQRQLRRLFRCQVRELLCQDDKRRNLPRLVLVIAAFGTNMPGG